VIVANLKPVKLRGVESQGMILAAEDADGERWRSRRSTATCPTAPRCAEPARLRGPGPTLGAAPGVGPTLGAGAEGRHTLR
jgi:hypothetical protein